MSYSDGNDGWKEIDDDDFPDLSSEEGRDKWVEILMAQDDETLARNGSGWCKALTAVDDQGNMVARFVYPNGSEEVFDLAVRRSIDVSAPAEEMN